MPGAGGAGVSTGGRKASVSKRKGKTMTPRQRAHAERVAADELKYASKVVSALLREKGAREFTWVFDSVPDKSLDFAPAYYAMIKRPIALDTIDGKLKQGDYNDLAEFEADMNLLFDNCFTFNTPGSDVFIMGERTRALFRERMKKMPKAKEMSPEMEDDEDEDALGEDDDEGEKRLYGLACRRTG
jgi:bromodomain-containing factor 1